MAHSDKNIVITPNISSTTADPRIVFSGADASTGPQNITLQVYPTNSGTLSFEGSTGQLFSITNSMSGTIFSANDVSGIPSIEVLDTGLVKIAQYSGNFLIGSGTDSGIAKVQITGDQTVSGKTIYGPNATWGAYLQVGGSSREYVDNGTYASVAASDGNLHLDAASGKDLYLNYYDGSTVKIGGGANNFVAVFNTSGSLTLNGELTVGNGANASNIYMADSDEGQRTIHCNSNQIGFLKQNDSWGAYCDDSGNWYANNISGSTSGTNTGDQTSVSGNAGTVGGFTPSASSGTANRVVVADANGYIFNNYFNSTDDTTTATLTYIMGKFGDNYLRSASATKVAAFISGQTMNISGNATTASNGGVTSVNGQTGAVTVATSSGTVTSVAAGSYLTGGTITSTGTLAVDATSSNTASKVVARDSSGNFSAGLITSYGRQDNYGTDADSGTVAGIQGGTSGGTIASPTQTLNGTTLYRVSPVAYTGSGWTGGAGLEFVATENITAGARGTNAVLRAITPGQGGYTTMVFNGTTVVANGTTLTGNTGTVTSVATGTGLTGGTITTSGTISLTNTGVSAGSYTLASITVDAQGRITSASNGSGGGGGLTFGKSLVFAR